MKELELECLKPTPSEKLSAIGLALLKYVSSHKGLTYVHVSKTRFQELTLIVTFLDPKYLTSTHAANTWPRRHSATLLARTRSRGSFPSSIFSQNYASCISCRSGRWATQIAFENALRCRR